MGNIRIRREGEAQRRKRIKNMAVGSPYKVDQESRRKSLVARRTESWGNIYVGGSVLIKSRIYNDNN